MENKFTLDHLERVKLFREIKNLKQIDMRISPNGRAIVSQFNHQAIFGSDRADEDILEEEGGISPTFAMNYDSFSPMIG